MCVVKGVVMAVVKRRGHGCGQKAWSWVWSRACSKGVVLDVVMGVVKGRGHRCGHGCGQKVFLVMGVVTDVLKGRASGCGQGLS